MRRAKFSGRLVSRVQGVLRRVLMSPSFGEDGKSVGVGVGVGVELQSQVTWVERVYPIGRHGTPEKAHRAALPS
jgi:hypothetical protein